jgi:hypothetical protein
MPRAMKKSNLYHFRDSLTHDWLLVKAESEAKAWAILIPYLRSVSYTSDDGHGPEEARDVFECTKAKTTHPSRQPWGRWDCRTLRA